MQRSSQYLLQLWEIYVDHHGAAGDRFLPNVRPELFLDREETPKKMEHKNMQDCFSLPETNIFSPWNPGPGPQFRKVHRFQPLKISGGGKPGTVSGEG